MQQLCAVRWVHLSPMLHIIMGRDTTVSFLVIENVNLTILLRQMKYYTKFMHLDSTPVELNGRVQVLENGDLLISNVRETDSGWYSCIRSNEAGTVTGQAYLGVMGTYDIHSLDTDATY